MGTSLTGLTPSTTYDALIKVGDNGPITSTLKTLSDGLGNDLPMEASTTAVNFTGTLTQAGATLQPTLVSGTNIKTINGASVLGSGNIPVVTSPSGVAGAIQFSDGSAFASDAANLFWDNTNKRLSIGTNDANSRTLRVVGESRLGDIVVGFGSDSRIVNAYGSTSLNIEGIGVGISSVSESLNPSARLHIKGSGSTSATTSLLVQNSAGSTAVQVYDDGKVNINQLVFGGNNGYIGINNSPSIDTALRNVRADNGTSPLSISTGEVGVGDTTTYASAIFAIGSTTRGFLPPRMTTTQKNAIATPAAGLVVYDSTTNKLCCYDGSTWNDLF